MITETNKSCYLLCGDFNVNPLKVHNHRYTNEFFNTMSASLFRPLIGVPTRFTEFSSTPINTY